MAGLTLGRGKDGMIRSYTGQFDIAELSPMGEKLQAGRIESGMTLDAVLLVVAAVALLRVVERLQWMDLQPVAPVALRDVIPPVIVYGEVCIDTTPLVAIEAERLVMALSAVLFPFARHKSMSPHPVRVMVQGYSFRFMAAVALGNLHRLIFFMRLFLGNRLLATEHSKYEHNGKEPSFHDSTPFQKS